MTGIVSCNSRPTLFVSLPSSETGIDFINKVVEDDTCNVLEYMNIYTGAGVAAGDINNDGLTDLYFSANRNGGRLYLNKGNLEFEDITEKSGFVSNRWETGVSMVDINQDGWLDIYVNVAGSEKFGDLSNLLYINNGNGTFTESAASYGLADKRLTMNASFFDYDKDGDLDVFLITNPADEMVSGVNTISKRNINGESKGTDILFRNNGNNTFSDVSAEAGILIEGYSLGAAISDLNSDGWPDIYVSNDFIGNDILYINNHDGTFTDKSAECLKHTSFASMGNDVADFNNDGLPDIYVVDMLPEDNFRRKMIIPAASYDRFQLSLEKGYEPQYTRNTLQLNNGNGTFSEIALLAGVSSTDWSWSALWADYDNDGDKDLMVTNGFYRDLGDLDYIHYQARLKNPMGTQNAKRELKLNAIKNLKNIPLNDYLFENTDNLGFKKRSEEWGFDEPGFSNGACYADLDNDGDLELIISGFNSKARVYKNTANERLGNNYLNIRLHGNDKNRQGIGAKLWLYAGGKMQFQEFNPYRGFESSMDPLLHFGLEKLAKIDSLLIEWPDGKKQMNYPGINQTVLINYEARKDSNSSIAAIAPQLFTDVTGKLGIAYEHIENEFVDFKMQPLLPVMHSQNGPGIAVGDVNGDSREDFFVGAASGSDGRFFIQNIDGKFKGNPLPKSASFEDMGLLLFDADNDRDLDLYAVSGGSENMEGTEAQQDRLYINDGKGNFSEQHNALPDTKSSGSCVIAADYDHDGDLDLFIGGRVSPGLYPESPKSYLLKNNGGKFSDASRELPYAGKLGMVTSALWTDYDNDGWRDLMYTGEFMPVAFLKNNKGKLDSNPVVIDNSNGWWNSIAACDFDEDGDIDYIVGNLGLNSRYKASAKEPVCIYAKDFDKNGRIDPVICHYVDGKNYVYATRDEMIKQMSAMRGRFPTYSKYASVTFDESFNAKELDDATLLRAECFESSYFENTGNGKFKRKPLPVEAQFAPVFGLQTGDFDDDGHQDILIAGNAYSTEASTGRYDAMSGLLLSGDGKGNFISRKSSATGFKADKSVKGLAELFFSNGNSIMLVANNNSKMEAYALNHTPKKVFAVNIRDEYAIMHKADGSSCRQEFYIGSNYLSQSARVLKSGKNIVSATIYDVKGNKKDVEF